MEQNVKEFQFCISMPNFSFLGSIIKNKKTKVASQSPCQAKEHPSASEEDFARPRKILHVLGIFFSASEEYFSASEPYSSES